MVRVTSISYISAALSQLCDTTKAEGSVNNLISSALSQLCDITSTKADGSVNNLILVDITIITMKKAKAECDLLKSCSADALIARVGVVLSAGQRIASTANIIVITYEQITSESRPEKMDYAKFEFFYI